MIHKAISLLPICLKIMLALFIALVFLPPAFQIYPKIVLSGSMEPTIPVGSIAYIATSVSAEKVKQQDIIAYEMQDGTLILHRVKDIYSQEKKFQTKGDANDTEDIGLVSYEQYEGKYIFCIPFAGYAIEFLRNKYAVLGIFCFLAVFLLTDIIGTVKERKTT